MTRFLYVSLAFTLGLGAPAAAQRPDDCGSQALVPAEAGQLPSARDEAAGGSTGVDTPESPSRWPGDERGVQLRSVETSALEREQGSVTRTLDPGNASRTRLMLGPTARALRQGEFYVDLSGFVGGPFVQVGVTDRVSIGAGTPVLVPGIRPGQLFVVTPKVQIVAGPRTQAAVGLAHYTNGGAEHTGVAYGVVTRGSTDAAVTAGVGFSYYRFNRREESGKPVVILGGEKRVTPRLKLITENYAGFGSSVVSGGVRLTRGHGTFDFGLATWLGSGATFVLPVFRLAWNL